MDTFLFAILGGALYIVPGTVATVRGHHQASAIALLNLFLGWFFFVWVGALVWAALPPREPRVPSQVAKVIVVVGFVIGIFVSWAFIDMMGAMFSGSGR